MLQYAEQSTAARDQLCESASPTRLESDASEHPDDDRAFLAVSAGKTESSILESTGYALFLHGGASKWFIFISLQKMPLFSRTPCFVPMMLKTGHFRQSCCFRIVARLALRSVETE